MSELKFAFRQMLKNPGFTAVVVLTLAFGIGASTAIYSVVSNVLISPMPGPAPCRLIEIVQHQKFGVSADVLAALRANQAFFSDLAWFHDLVLWSPINQLLKHQLFQAGGTDSLVWSAAVFLLMGVALLACYVPARRAASVGPLVALRCE